VERLMHFDMALEHDVVIEIRPRAAATGIALEFPSTHGALVEDRSGLAVRGVTTLAGWVEGPTGRLAAASRSCRRKTGSS